MVYDACAAPGGKSVALERGGARLLAGDGRRERVGRLVETARRAGVAIQVAVRSSGGPVPVRGVRSRARGCPLFRHRHDGPAPGRPLAGDPADDRARRGTPTGPARRGGGAGPTGRIARLRNVLTRAGGEIGRAHV